MDSSSSRCGSDQVLVIGCRRKRCSGGALLYQAVGGSDRAFQFAMDWDLLLLIHERRRRDFSGFPIPWGAFAFTISRKRMLFRIASVSRRRTFSWPANTQGSTTPNRRRSCVIPMPLRSSLCAILPKCGTRH